MSLNPSLFLVDMRQSCQRIARYVSGMDYSQFLIDERTYDAVLRNLTIIGEAAKQIPEEVRSQYPTIEWHKIGRFRDLVIHRYFAIDNEIIWDVVSNKVPELLALLEAEDTVDEL